MNYIPMIKTDSYTRYINEMYIDGKPSKRTSNSCFLQQSYQKYWATKILNERNLYKDYELYLEDLIDDISNAMTSCNSENKRWFFSVGYDVLLNALDIFDTKERNSK